MTSPLAFIVVPADVVVVFLVAAGTEAAKGSPNPEAKGSLLLMLLVALPVVEEAKGSDEPKPKTLDEALAVEVAAAVELGTLAKGSLYI